VTTFRTEGGYRDRRRPDEVSFGASLAEDLARRDFTVNAMAWVPTAIAARRGSLIDPYGGVADLRAGILRAVGDPDERLTEDALRLLRAVRFAHALELRLDPATEAAIRRHAALAASVSGERLRDELLRIVGADRPPPSGAFRLMERLGLLSVVLPELAALRGIPQAKRIPGDALDHTLRALDAAEAGDTTLRLAALLHDTGKADTLAGGHFYGHEKLGAERTRGVLERLRIPRTEIEAIVAAVRHHMFAYAPEWTDAAVRRFVRRVGRRRIPLLLALRRADNVASGVEEPNLGGLTELEARVAAVSEAPLGREELAIDGHDLQRELGVAAGPGLGRLLDRLMEAVIDDPSLNDRHRLLELAREELAPG
jgi:tRNA nucleotidyltransferase/poly(A) polymerase